MVRGSVCSSSHVIPEGTEEDQNKFMNISDLREEANIATFKFEIEALLLNLRLVT
jgi:hypothetical protein